MAEKLLMPALSPTMEAGLLVKWLKEEGDTVEEGEIIAEVETDKATMELASFYEGTLLKRVIQEQDSVPVEALVAIIGAPGEDISALLAEETSGASAPQAAVTVEAIVSPAPPAAVADGRRLRSSPLARKIAADAGIELASIAGSGPGGRIIKRDVEGAVAAQRAAATATPAPAPARVATTSHEWAEDVAPEPLSNMRRTIARRLTEVWIQAPHFFLEVGVRMDAALALRAELNSALTRSGSSVKISVNDLIVKASALALQDHPEVNVAFSDEGMRAFAGSHIGIAVAVPEGLVVPVLRNVEQKGLRSIASEGRALVMKARDKKLTPSEMQGATFSISNLGMFGIERFTAVINAPAACILAVGAARKVPIVNDDDSFGIARVMQATLSCDHRAVDGAVGARFLATLKTYLEEPMLLVAG